MNHHQITLPFFLYPFLINSFGFNTKITTSYAGKDFVKNNNDFPIHMYKITSAKINHNQFAEFYAFFNARKGSLYSFYLKDFGDFQVINQALTVNSEGSKRFRLYKYYDDNINPHRRPLSIIKPESIKLTQNGSEVNYRYFPETSEIEVLAELILGSNLEISFEFEVKVHFITTKIEYSHCADGSILLNEIVMKEVIDV